MPNWAQYYSSYPRILKKTSQDSVIYSPNFRRMSGRPVSSVTPPGGQKTSTRCCAAQIPRCASRIQRKGRRRSSRRPTSDTCAYAMKGMRPKSWVSGQNKSRRWEAEAPGPMRTSFSNTKKKEWALNWHGSSYSWPAILRIPKRQNRPKNKREEDQPQGEADVMAEVLRQAVRHHDRDDDIHDRNQVEQNPPDWLAGKIENDDRVVDGNDRCPARLSGLLEHLPHRSDVEENDRAPDQPEHHAGALRRLKRVLHRRQPWVKGATKIMLQQPTARPRPSGAWPAWRGSPRDFPWPLAPPPP